MNQALSQLFATLPRECGKYKDYCQYPSDINYVIKKHNGYSDCYIGLYQLPRNEVKHRGLHEVRSYKCAVIDKLFFDLDRDNAWDIIKIMHIRLIEEDIKHTIILSGGGFHLYVFTKLFTIDDIKEQNYKTESSLKRILRNAQEYLLNLINKPLQLKITVGDAHHADLDRQTFGDLSKQPRVPNCWHPKRKRYSIPIIESDFELDFEKLCLIAQQPRSVYQSFGTKLIDMSIYVNKATQCDYVMPVVKDIHINIKDHNIIKLLPLFIQNLLNNHIDGHQARYLTEVSMRVRGFSKNMAIDICEAYWCDAKFKHALYGHGINEFENIWARQDLFFPNWGTLTKQGWSIPEEDYAYKEMWNR